MLQDSVVSDSSKVYSVYELLKIINDRISEFGIITVCGCVLSVINSNKGYIILTLSDDNVSSPKQSIQAWAFNDDVKQDVLDLNFRQGDRVLVTGELWIHKSRSTVAIRIKGIAKEGISRLLLEFEKLKSKYQQLGYFDQARKKPIPSFPSSIVVITSISAGIVLADFYYGWRRFYPKAKLTVFDVPVQGQGSVEAVVSAIKIANSKKLGDVILLMRGGGSLTDLWTFNEPQVIEAIYNSAIPVVTAIGHDADVTLADFVADLSVPTPTAAAVKVLPQRVKYYDLIRRQLKALEQLTKLNTFYGDVVHLETVFSDRSAEHFKSIRTKLENLDKLLSYLSPEIYLQERLTKLNALNDRFNSAILAVYLQFFYNLERTVKNLISTDVERFSKHSTTITARLNMINETVWRTFQSKLNLMNNLFSDLKIASPLGPLERGYALVMNKKMEVLEFSQVNIGDEVGIMFKDGSLSARILDKDELDHR